MKLLRSLAVQGWMELLLTLIILKDNQLDMNLFEVNAVLPGLGKVKIEIQDVQKAIKLSNL